MRIRKNNKSQLTEQLKEQIFELLKHSSYKIVTLKIDDSCFGNVYLELSNATSFLRFIQDRGDVYVERRAANKIQWNDCLFLSHNESEGQYYGLLLKAITLVLAS